MLILSYENEISLTCKLNSFSYERMSTKTRFEEEAKGNSEMAYYSFRGLQFKNCTVIFFIVSTFDKHDKTQLLATFEKIL